MKEILETSYPTPIQLTEKHTIIDGSKLKCYLTCERQFFYKYVLGWSPLEPSIHLEGGSAYHKGQEFLLLNWGKLPPAELFKGAVEVMSEYYRRFFPAELDEQNGPKSLQNLSLALMESASRFEYDKVKPLYTEVVGAVPLDESTALHVRLDSVVEHETYGLVIDDHKTTTMDSQAWADQWQLDQSIHGYLYAATVLFADRPLYGARILGSILRKKGNDFRIVTVKATPNSVLSWFWETLFTIQRMKEDYERLSEMSQNHPILEAFPRRRTSCLKYGICEYHAYCSAWDNPLQHCETPPPSFQVKHWDPREAEKQARFVIREEGLVEQTPAQPEAPATSFGPEINLLY